MSLSLMPVTCFSWDAGPRRVGGVSDALDDDDLQLARAVLLAVRRGLEVLGRFVAGDRLLEARELDDDEAVEFLRALEDLELAAAREELAAELLEDAWCQVGVLLVLIGIVALPPRDPIGDHLILHASREHPCQNRATAHSCCEIRSCLARTVRPMPNCFPIDVLPVSKLHRACTRESFPHPEEPACRDLTFFSELGKVGTHFLILRSPHAASSPFSQRLERGRLAC